jgi:hypothetical protein
MHLLRQLRHHRGPGLLDRPRNRAREGFVRVCAGCGRKGAVPDPDSSRDWIRFLRKGGGIGIGRSRISVLKWYGCTGWEVKRGAVMLVGYDCDQK